MYYIEIYSQQRFYFLGRRFALALCLLLYVTSAHAGFNRNVTVVADDATLHQAFVDCNNVVMRQTVAKQTANWNWQLAIYDGDRDGLKNDVVFIGSRSSHRMGPHVAEVANRLVTLDLDAICDNAAGQAARVPQHSQRSTIHGPMGHEDYVQIRADGVPGGGVGVRISIQLNHLDQQSPIPLDAPLIAPPTNPDDQGSSEEEDGENGEEGSGQGDDGQEEGSSSDTEEDCNNNGLADAIDIAIGVDGDANGDGVPNACELPESYGLSAPVWGLLITILFLVIIIVLLKRPRQH